MDQQILQDNHDLESHDNDVDMDISSDDTDGSSSDSNEDPFVTLLRNQGAVF